MEKLSLDEVGWFFVQEYYTFLNKEPRRLHCFYTKKSTFVHGNEGEVVKPCSGQQEIHEKILELGFSDCKVLVSNVDSQASASGGIVIQVLGEMSNCDGPSRKFAQTFFLAEQPNGYFVLNDIFRYLKEDIDDVKLCDGECHSYSLDFRNDMLPSCLDINDKTPHVPEEKFSNISILSHDNNSNFQSNQICTITEPSQELTSVVSVTDGHHEISYEKQPLVSSSEKISSIEHIPSCVQNSSFNALESQSPIYESSTISRPKTWADLFDKPPVHENKKAPSIAKPVTIYSQPASPLERAPARSVSGNFIIIILDFYFLYVFVKNVKDRISEEDLRQALSKFGIVHCIELKREKNCALVYFETAAAVASAIAASSVKINKDTILIEERRNNYDRSRNINGERRTTGREYTKYSDEKRIGNDRRGYVNKDKGHDKR
ncbi:hypothetical protein T552_02062 [Pneumocystis carinii B80]|uniref:NTF2 domain-containing protein n=1 Tax=Pneumocystis carinii (strain B80) TaxID=1408658 RepID=A0A0W4ZGX8_PNEC8|nr:hypothetical protein T552_02062 [Pneumocystis carinii B80]KTW27620.1 hypothetical protein T552_02062 [Pneumocystis carinii B80]